MKRLTLVLLLAIVASSATGGTLPFQQLPPTHENPYGLTTEKQFAAAYSSVIWPEFLRGKQGTFQGVGNVNLHYRAFPPLGASEKGTIVISSGRTEGLIIYPELIHDLRRQGYAVYIHDHRGQGFSGGRIGKEQRGDVSDFDHYVADLKTFVDEVVPKPRNGKLFLLAHSMGGGIATLFMERYAEVFQAAALIAPMHDPLLPGPVTDKDRTRVICGASLVAKAWLNPAEYALGQTEYVCYPFNDPRNDLTQSPVRWNHTRAIYHAFAAAKVGGPTHRWIREACAAAEEARENAASIAIPVLLIQAQNDAAVRNESQEEFCKAAPRCEGYSIPGARHALFIERDDFRLATLNKTIEFFNRESAKK
jgi:lysophospholipase